MSEALNRVDWDRLEADRETRAAELRNRFSRNGKRWTVAEDRRVQLGLDDFSARRLDPRTLRFEAIKQDQTISTLSDELGRTPYAIWRRLCASLGALPRFYQS